MTFSIKNVFSNIISFPRLVLEKITKRALKALTRSIKIYSPGEVTDIPSLKKRVKKGDVLLISGAARISHVVKVLTMSQWSHVVLYVGDRRDLLTEVEKSEWAERYGEDALKQLVIDADPMRQVHLKPIDDYDGLMLRHCRPEALKKNDIDTVCERALIQLGKEYDIKHIIRLLFFFAFPWELLPETLRRFITDFTLSETDRICSRVLSEAFHSVGYPIRPTQILKSQEGIHNRALDLALGIKHRRRTAARLFFSGKLKKAVFRISDPRYTEIHLRQTRHITPSDYDLSRFFTIVKNPQDLSFDYKKASVVCPIPEK